ncbi:hypothetical protein A3H26_01950 [candidate division WWE3 bacterium RIFCSPLOWO2_12_FULL_36_10]|uniref:Cell envelope-related transcriptional attenuator domain-containing protein n=1 Tax=candidate division WWE3 bacterium RIFCSPLOWO2_12_FULL_36_10 TaxID=1802630 RepID=A0A1F4VGP7_UNCKA|nr:MAG: hypothetical protein A3H26_01950 [candidate division WWE3 bacterium RIFCSPLOWO2_12_FULL_36_10]
MQKKSIISFITGILISIILLSLMVGGGLFFYLKNLKLNGIFLTPIEKNAKKPNLFSKIKGTPKYNTIFKEDETLNVLLLGIDRRSKSQEGFNTDAMILLSINPKTNKVLLTSVPRDLWINGNKINALYTVYGWETLKDAYEKITGQKIDGYIRADFEDFRWIVDSFSGVPINIEASFTDTTFPNNSDTGVITASFTQGSEKMSGERALIFARSRHGDNGEGSDLKRAKRQHIILKGMLEAVKQPESIFWPMDVDNFYKVTTTHMSTTISLDDAYYLWDFYKDKDKYSIESFVIGDDYIYFPGLYPASPYHAWVFIPRDESFTQLHQDITDKLNGTFVTPKTP